MKKNLLKKMLLLCALIVGGVNSVWATDIALTTDAITIDNFSSVGSSYVTPAADKTIGGYTWSVYQCMNLGKYSGVTYNNLQMKSGAGTITSPTITSSNGFTVTVTYSSSKALTLQIGSETAQTGTTTATNDQAGTGASVTATTTSTSTSFKLSAGGAVAYVSSIVITPTSGSASDPSISASNVNIAYTATAGSITYSVSNPVDGGALTAARTAGDWLTVGAVSAGSVAFTCSANTGLQRTATVRLTYTYNTSETVTKDVTITQALAPQTYTLASSLTPGKTYVIASGTSGSVKIMGEQNKDNRGAVDGTVSETTLTTANSPAEVVVYGPDASGFYTLSTADGYLYAPSSSSNNLKSRATNSDANGKWTITVVGGKAVITAQGDKTRNLMRYNSGSSLFSCYASGQADIYLYEKTGSPVATTTSVKLNAYGYATFATTTALDFLDADDASYSAWQITGIDGENITFSQIKGTVAAGKGILLKGTANTTISLNILPAGGDALSTNKLVSITSATEVADNAYYGLSGNVFKKVNAGTVPAGKALLPADLVSSPALEFKFVFEDETSGISNLTQAFSEGEGAIYDLQGRKVAVPKKGGLYIMNGKKVVIK